MWRNTFVYYSYSSAKKYSVAFVLNNVLQISIKNFYGKKNLNTFFMPSLYGLKRLYQNLFQAFTTILRHWKVVQHNFELRPFCNNRAWDESVDAIQSFLKASTRVTKTLQNLFENTPVLASVLRKVVGLLV